MTKQADDRLVAASTFSQRPWPLSGAIPRRVQVPSGRGRGRSCLIVQQRLSSPFARWLALAFLLILAQRHTVAADDSLLVRPPGMSLSAFAAAIIPADMKLAHQAVSGNFGPFRESLVVLFHADEFREFTGWVLVPENGGYRKHVLPEVPFPVSTEVKAVFFADTNGDRERELLILAQHISGVGSYPGNVKPFCATYPYTWDGTRFVFLEDLSAILDRCTAVLVRQQLAKKEHRKH